MKKHIFLAVLGLFLSSCSMFHVHKVEVEQGNVMTPAMVNRLHAGMTKGQVKAVMGDPILINVMNPSLESYVYTDQIGSDNRIEKRVTLTFDHGVVRNIKREGV